MLILHFPSRNHSVVNYALTMRKVIVPKEKIERFDTMLVPKKAGASSWEQTQEWKQLSSQGIAWYF